MEVSNDTAKPTKTLLPGFGRPLNYKSSKTDPDYIGDRFGSALSTPDFVSGCMLPLTTVREFVMLQFMNSITDKLDWHIKVNNPEIMAKWKQEALASNHEDLTTKFVDYCLEELRYKLTLIPAPPSQLPPVVVYNGDVVKSDSALSPEFKEELQQAVKTFEAKVPERLKDWHPESDGKVLDLVHPSLFPLVYGRTRILENGKLTTLEDCIEWCGQGKITTIPGNREAIDSRPAYYLQSPYSRTFQWLPCEVDISGDKARITSYINNLHPYKERPLYHLLEKLIDACIPLWDLTLAPLRSPEFIHQQRIKYNHVEYEVDKEEQMEDANVKGDNNLKTDRHSEIENEGEGEGEYETEDEDEDEDEGWSMKTVIRPEPELPFVPFPSPPKFSLRDVYGKCGLQVIVKMANIELTPEKPSYDGGCWHIEGQLNEHIVATALYYYSSSNITPSTLFFCQWFSQDDMCNLSYPQGASSWLAPIYGCKPDGPSVQDIGGVKTHEGRLLTFPNILQHRVSSFKLSDLTRPGHRKIITLFLVDPNIKVISTAHVPCQQQEWWWDRFANDTQGSAGIGSLPRELQDHILADVDFLVSLQEAKDLRKALMKERMVFSFDHSDVLNSHFTISLCEH